MKKCVYAGSFDPITIGHLWMIEHGAKLFDELVVAIGVNSDKVCTFSINERMEMLRESAKKFSNVVITTFENQFLISYTKSIGAGYILRGIRTEGDYGYERAMRYVNSDLDSGITTVFLMPDRELVEISSSLVKGLVGPEGWQRIVKKYLPKSVYKKFLEKFNERS